MRAVSPKTARDGRRVLLSALLVLVLSGCSAKESAKPAGSPPGGLVIQGSIEPAAADHRLQTPDDDPPPPSFDQEDPPPEGGAMVAVHVLDLATRKASTVAMIPGGMEPLVRRRDGASLRLQGDGRLWDIEYRDGTWQAVALLGADAFGDLARPVVSHNGTREAFECRKRAGRICVSGIDGASAEQEVISPVPYAHPLAWLDDGRLVLGTIYSAEQRQVVAIDPATNTASTPFALPAGAGIPAVSAGGQVAWAEVDGDRLALVVGAVDALSAARRFDLGSGRSAECSFAAEDVVVCRPSTDHGHPLVSVLLADGVARVLDDEVLQYVSSPDGRWVAYVRLGEGGGRIRVTPVDRAAPTPLLPGDPLVPARLLGWLQRPPT